MDKLAADPALWRGCCQYNARTSADAPGEHTQWNKNCYLSGFTPTGGKSDIYWGNGVNGDPMTSLDGGEPIRFFLPTCCNTTLLKQRDGIEVVVVGGPTYGLGEVRRGDWMTKIYILVQSRLVVRATLLPTAPLLEAPKAKPLEAEPEVEPLGARSRLTTLDIQVDEAQINTTGSVATSAGGMPVHVTVDQAQNKWIGATGHPETANITIGDFALYLWTSKAHKFEAEADKAKFTHLDLKLLQFDRNQMAGALPELWGLKPMSAATKKLLEPDGR